MLVGVLGIRSAMIEHNLFTKLYDLFEIELVKSFEIVRNLCKIN